MLKKIYFLPLLLALLLSACTAKVATTANQSETILDAYWILLSLEGQSVQRPNNTQTAYIRFQENDNDITGFTGCNRLYGKYELAGSVNAIRLTNLNAAEVACNNSEQEAKMLRLLPQVTTYSITGDLLTLYAGGGRAVATFRTGAEHMVTTPAPVQSNQD
ncbi:META domain-containing protein [Pontibacter harenae]|uniref:META domain-containing protein n=1 Tax=Pontibacter harenae TaxID=2894083 RepID=UPI001E3CF382|nr:META domain-containing protein [Pontibacter harenae]MCC9166249.1 META domain-containing protein [Pontibacter harenae]